MTTTPPTFTLDGAAMATIAARAVLDSITPEQRDQILVRSVAWLLEPTERGDGFRRAIGPSPAQEAFNQAVARKANALAVELVDSDPTIDEKIRAIFADCMTRMASDPDTQIVMADAIARALTERRH